MAYVQWSRRFELGVPFIDSDHKVLVGLLNRMNDAARTDGDLADIGGILSGLVDYTRYHFAREERAQDAAGYPDIDEHREQHARLAIEARRLFEAYRRDPGGIEVGDILDFLSDWLMDHILLHDMAIKPYLLANFEAVSAAEGVDYASLMSEGTDRKHPDWSRLAVLAVEDSRPFAHVLQAILNVIGIQNVAVANDAEEGLRLAAETPYDLILADWRMEGMDGLDFVHSARNRGVAAPVVMLTGYVDESLEAAREGFQISEWLQKPVTSAELMACIARHVPA
ncbi:putative Hemerythrin [uncultured Alphaproteobacteria bacterium]|uniref:Putative Hemerythrin n=1 Tax=uncultured Alphaproteobacteria bacterium TaxID=91750 RepID=A0A212J2D5_9PROT|nr:putative Hemerythrin [uncultured Alphaproteobacteria bacterium]